MIAHNKFTESILSVLGVSLIVLVALAIAVKAHDVTELVKDTAYPSKTIAATGEEHVMAKPDTAYMTYEMTAYGTEERGARDAYLKKFNDFADGLKTMGIDKSNIMTTAFDMTKDDTASRDKKYKATVTVQVKIEDKKALDDTIKAVYDFAIKQELKTSTASYNQCATFKDQSEYFTPEVREEASEKARESAQKIADAAGLELGKVVNATDYTSSVYYPTTGACAYPVPGVPIQPVELTVSVNLTFGVK